MVVPLWRVAVSSSHRHWTSDGVAKKRKKKGRSGCCLLLLFGRRLYFLQKYKQKPKNASFLTLCIRELQYHVQRVFLAASEVFTMKKNSHLFFYVCIKNDGLCDVCPFSFCLTVMSLYAGARTWGRVVPFLFFLYFFFNGSSKLHADDDGFPS